MSRDFPGAAGAVSHYLRVTDATPIDISGTALTIHCFQFLDNVNTLRRHVSKWTGNTQTGRQYLLEYTGTPRWECAIADAAGIDVVTTTTAPTAGVWHAIGLRKSGTGAGALAFFLNGASIGSSTSNRSIQTTTTDLVLGCTMNDSGSPIDGIDGKMAEVAIWAAGLGDVEMAALAKGVSPLLIRPQSLRGYWPLWGTGSPERDYSGNGMHATITGTVPSGRHSPSMPFIPPTIIGEFTPVPPKPASPYPPLAKSMAALLRR